jgi:hypothetical protein
MMRTDPARYSVLIGNLLDGFGADHIIWGTDTPVIGPPHWQIEAFQTFTIPEELAAQYHFSRLTPEVKNKIFGENAARIFGIVAQLVEQVPLYSLARRGDVDRNPLPSGAAPTRIKVMARNPAGSGSMLFHTPGELRTVAASRQLMASGA